MNQVLIMDLNEKNNEVSEYIINKPGILSEFEKYTYDRHMRQLDGHCKAIAVEESFLQVSSEHPTHLLTYGYSEREKFLCWVFVR
jgi:hypothetical protein